MQSMTGALKGQPQTSMISHLVNVCFGYIQLRGWLGAKLQRQSHIPGEEAKKKANERISAVAPNISAMLSLLYFR